MEIKKIRQGKFILLPIIFLLMLACEKEVFGPVVISSNISFKSDIQPILTNNCTSCHPPTRGLNLTADYAYKMLVPKYAAVADSANPKASKLYVKLTGTAHLPRTSDIEKEKILKWISEGVPNN